VHDGNHQRLRAILVVSVANTSCSILVDASHITAARP
jgi:hypothetical protein